MDGPTLQSICVKSCEDMYEQVGEMQKGADRSENKIAFSLNDIASIKRATDCWHITLTRRLPDTENLGIRINLTESGKKEDFLSDAVQFDNYEERSLTIDLYPSEKLDRMLMNAETSQIKILSDMKWLIALTKQFYEELGDRIGYPQKSCSFDRGKYRFPDFGDDRRPTDQQKEAVHTILNSELSYVWGAPGTGKTQFVLATSIIAHLRRGERVAVFAPTNNALEQVLRGVMKVIASDDPDHRYIDPDKDILRLGTPTRSFFREFKGVCENKAVGMMIAQLETSAKTIRDVIDERRIDSMKPLFEKLRELEKSDALNRNRDDVRPLVQSLKKIGSTITSFSGMFETLDEYNIGGRIDNLENVLYCRDRPALEIEKYSKMDEAEIENEMMNVQNELGELMGQETIHRIETAKILAMTPYILMARRQALIVDGRLCAYDHIFVDEVGYCNLIQTMPVFACGIPVSMLGDHMQLPPVCELDKDLITDFLANPCDDLYMKYSYMWDQSALNIESFLFGEEEETQTDYLEEREPRFSKTRMVKLTKTHRFSDNLARILDDSVYRNGIEGIGEEPISIECYDIIGDSSDKRVNNAEAEAVAKFVEENKDELGDFAILTPYRDHKKRLEKLCKGHKDYVLTIHSAQGREWDTIIISVCDNRHSSREVPFRFTSSIAPNTGLKVMNTAVSRAKKRIILFCDHEFWKERAALGDLLGLLAAEATVINKGDANASSVNPR